jgi:hypothetical protein
LNFSKEKKRSIHKMKVEEGVGKNAMWGGEEGMHF